MKKNILSVTAAAALVFAACSNSHKTDEATAVTDSTHYANAYDSLNNSRGPIAREITEYREKISRELNHMDNKIAEMREKRKAEKDHKKQKEYEIEIASREKNKESLREKLDKMDSYIDAKWEDFKREADALFEKDWADSTYRHKE